MCTHLNILHWLCSMSTQWRYHVCRDNEHTQIHLLCMGTIVVKLFTPVLALCLFLLMSNDFCKWNRWSSRALWLSTWQGVFSGPHRRWTACTYVENDLNTLVHACVHASVCACVRPFPFLSMLRRNKPCVHPFVCMWLCMILVVSDTHLSQQDGINYPECVHYVY